MTSMWENQRDWRDSWNVSGVRLGKGGVEVRADYELAVEYLDRQAMAHDLLEEKGATYRQWLIPEAGGQRNGLGGRQQAVAKTVEEDIHLGHNPPVVRRPDLVPL